MESQQAAATVPNPIDLLFNVLESTMNTPPTGMLLNGIQLLEMIRTFIEAHKTEFPLFPWNALYIAYAHFFKKYGNLDIMQLETTYIQCCLDIVEYQVKMGFDMPISIHCLMIYSLYVKPILKTLRGFCWLELQSQHGVATG